MAIKLNEAADGFLVKEIPLYSNLEPWIVERSTPEETIKQTRTRVCHEHIGMHRVDQKIEASAKEVVIFVDKNAAANGSGASWADPMKSIGGAVKKAFDIRQLLNNQGLDLPIYVLVAGGVYDQSHEKSILSAVGFGENTPLINFEGWSVFLHSNIHILGGYLSGDDCIELEKNDPNYKTNLQRVTVLDGEYKSNHVVNINRKAEGIVLSDFTVRKGRADDPRPGEDKEYGGAMIIHGGSTRITLKNIKMEDSYAAEKGGCLAILGKDDYTPSNITFSGEVSFTGCTAKKGGGGVYIGGNAHTIETKNGTLVVHKNIASHKSGSLGGGLLIAENAGVLGEIKIAGRITNNEADLYGGGVAIVDNAQHISFSQIAIENNLTESAVGEGGGVYIAGAGNDIRFVTGSIKGNITGRYGGGVMVTETGVTAAVLDPNPIPPARISFDSIDITENSLWVAGGGAKGAGVMLFAGAKGTGDVEFNKGSIAKNASIGSGVGLAIIGRANHVLMRNVAISKNITGTTGAYDGEGVYIDQDAAGDSPARIVFDGGSISDHGKGRRGAGVYANRVIGLEIRGVTFANNHSVLFGGGLFVTESNIIHAKNTYKNNTAKLRGGALAVSRAMNVTLTGIDIDTDPDSKHFSMEDITCTNNTASLSGGCAHIEAAPSMSILNGSYVENGNENDAEEIDNPTEEGGAIYYLSNSFTGIKSLLVSGGPPIPLGDDIDDQAVIIISAATFCDNRARFAGGAVFTGNTFDMILRSTTKDGVTKMANFEKNAAQYGGAIFADFRKHGQSTNFHDGAFVSIDGADFADNSSEQNGGALCFSSDLHTLLIQQGIFTGNSAVAGEGGAIYAHFKDVGATMLRLRSRVSFSQNHADALDQMGGAIYAYGPPKMVHVFAKFTNNSADAGGGAFYIGGTGSIANLSTSAKTEFSGNSIVKNDGGGLLMNVAVDNLNKWKMTSDVAMAPDDVALGNLGFFMGNYKENKAPAGEGGAVAFLKNVQSNQDEDTPHFRSLKAIFDGNQALKNPAIFFADPVKDYFFVDSKFLNHGRREDAGTCGGAMTLPEINNFSISGEIKNNVAEEGGAFCFVKINDSLNVTQRPSGNVSMVKENEATKKKGGFMMVKNGGDILDVSLDGAHFTKNKAEGSGGAISIPIVRSLTVNSCSFIENTSVNGDGGALQINLANSFHAEHNRTILNNVAGGNGGAFFVDRVDTNAGIHADVKNLNISAFWESLLLRAMSPTQPAPILEGVGQVSGNKANGGMGGGAFYFGLIAGMLTVNGQAWLDNSAPKGNGGALYVRQVGDEVRINSALMYKNQAKNGGALYIHDMHNSNFTLTHKDKYSAVEEKFGGFPLFRGTKDIHYFEDPQNRLLDPNHVLPVGEYLLTADLSLISGKFNNATRGIFMIEKNTAIVGHGGAFFIGNANNVTISKTSFGLNEAPFGAGGTMWAGLNGKIKLEKSIIYGGKAKSAAGAIYVPAGSSANDVEITMSSIQKSNLTKAITDCAGGMFVRTFQNLKVEKAGFFDNEVQADKHICAGALNFEHWNGAGEITFPGPIEFENNRVINGAAGSLGTVLLPVNAWNVFVSPKTGRLLGKSINNFPTPLNNDFNQVFYHAP